MIKTELKVAALENGTVIDHIPSEKVFEVVNIVHLDRMTTPVTIGYNLYSESMQKKSIIKIADKFFSDEELNQLSVIAQNVTLCVIRNYEVIEKKEVSMPQELVGIVRCNNPKCISNNEPGMRTRFIQQNDHILRCHYCNRQIDLENVKLV